MQAPCAGGDGGDEGDAKRSAAPLLRANNGYKSVQECIGSDGDVVDCVDIVESLHLCFDQAIPLLHDWMSDPIPKLKTWYIRIYTLS